MLLDLLNPNNQINCNLSFIKFFGLHTAVYISELMNIYSQCSKKHLIDTYEYQEYFPVPHDYIYERTTLDSQEQKAIEKRLIKVGIIQYFPEDENKIFLDLNQLTTFFNCDISKGTEESLAQIATASRKKTDKEMKDAKFNGLKSNLRRAINTSDKELQKLYYNWIDSAMGRYGMKMTKAAVQSAQDMINIASNGNIEVARQLVKMAAIKGYDNMKYVIDEYNNQSLQVKYAQQVGNEVAVQRVVNIEGEEF